MLSLDGVSKSFGAHIAVEGATFEVSRGETIALLGPSGCGKTTTLRMIAGFLKPDSGAIRLAGADITSSKPYERNIGIVFQDYALFPHLSVADNVAFGPRHRGVGKEETRQRVDRYLRLVQMSDKAASQPNALSGGQQQRVALARALATEPEIVLLDEPLSALDAKLRERLRSELKQILGAAGATTIIVTHDQEEALSLADRVLVMNGGRIMQDAAPREIYDRPANRFIAEFVGRSNWMKGAVTEDRTGFRMAGGALVPLAASLPAGRRVSGFIRPEKLRILEASGDTPSGMVSLPAAFRDAIFLGTDTEITCMLDTGDTVVVLDRTGRAAGLGRGDRVRVGFHPAEMGFVDTE